MAKPLIARQRLFIYADARNSFMASSKTKAPVFVRDATGLVREVSAWSAFWFTNAAMSTGLTILFVLYFLYLFPGADLILASVIAGVGFIPQALTYSMLSATMPRSAGEYVFVSRGLTPPIGVASGFAKIMWSFLWIGVYANWTLTIGANPALGALGALLNNQLLLSMGQAVAQPTWVIAIGALVIIGYGLIMILGTRHALRFLNALMIIGYAGLFAAIAVLATSTPTTFAAAFNAFSSHTIGDASYYGKIMGLGQQAGVTGARFSWSATLAVVPIASFAFIAVGDQTVFSGELKNARRNSFQGILGGLFFGILVFAVACFVCIQGVGYDFVTSIGYASANGNYSLSIPPYFNFLAMTLTNNVLVLALIALGYIAWNLSILPWGFFNISRFSLGLAFDRVFPSAFADVSERFHTPVKAILLAVVAGMVSLAIVTFSSLSFLALTLGQIITQWGLVALAGIVLPFKMRDLFASSPYGRKVGGIPIITVTSVLTIIWLVFVGAYLMSNPNYGAWNTESAYLIVGVFVTGLVIYFVARYYRGRQGIPLSMVFGQLPPE